MIIDKFDAVHYIYSERMVSESKKEPEICEQNSNVIIPRTSLVPDFDCAIPATCDDFGCLMG